MTVTPPRRSILFTPADRPEIFAKALGAGADMVCVDLEDGVASDLKDSARSHAFGFLRSSSAEGPERAVRINSPFTKHGLCDLNALVDLKRASGTIMLPKVNSANEVLWIDNLLGEAGLSLDLAALIETTIGVENAFEIARSTGRLSLVGFGGADLAMELGTPIVPEPLAYGRARVVYAARHAGIGVFDMPSTSFRDFDRVRVEAETARLLGFTGKAVLHPMNVDLVNKAFTPSEAELDEARRIVNAYNSSGTGVAVVDGKVVDKPIVRAMEMTLARGRAAG